MHVGVDETRDQHLVVGEPHGAHSGESRAERRELRDDAAAHADLGGDEPAVDEHPLAGDHEVVGSGCRGRARLRHPLAHPHRLAARPVLGSVSRTWRFTSL